MFRIVLALLAIPAAALADTLEFRQGATVCRAERDRGLPVIEELADETVPQADNYGRLTLFPAKVGTRVRLEPQRGSHEIKVLVWQTSVLARGWKRGICYPVLYTAEASTLITCAPGETITVPLPTLGAQLTLHRG
jgi:hypothetical protein